MAAAPPSTSISKDPYPFSYIRNSLNINSPCAGRIVSLKVRGCSAGEGINTSDRNERSSGVVNCGDGGGRGGFGLHKARAIGLRELVAEEIRFGLESSTFHGGGRYRSEEGGCLGFPEDPHLGPKKLVVAVDVDEGTCIKRCHFDAVRHV